MDVTTIRMEKSEAKERLRAYRRHVHTNADREFQQAETAYAALARGTPVLSLSMVLDQAPRDAKGRPRLAIGRADERSIRYVGSRRHENFQPDAWRGSRWNDARTVLVRRAREAVPGFSVEGYSIIPMIPAEVRPKRFDASAHWVLWEVEEWAERSSRATPDRDPYLLRRLADDLWAVVAEWDLTDVERLVMSSRAHA